MVDVQSVFVKLGVEGHFHKFYSAMIKSASCCPPHKWQAFNENKNREIYVDS